MTPPPSGLANAAGSLRQEMAAASSICQISPTRCQARTRLYRDGKLELRASRSPTSAITWPMAPSTIWLDLRGPDHDCEWKLKSQRGLGVITSRPRARPRGRPPRCLLGIRQRPLVTFASLKHAPGYPPFNAGGFRPSAASADWKQFAPPPLSSAR